MERTYRVRVIRQGAGVIRYTGTVSTLPGDFADLASALAQAVMLYADGAERIEVRATGGSDVGEWSRDCGVSFVVYY